jgi:hypothetical protein
MAGPTFINPFRPGAGHMPPYLAGRETETDEFQRLLAQDVILENLVLTGLRGVGKTVLLDTFKPVALESGWGWVGTDLSESTSVSEERFALRPMADLAVLTGSIVVESRRVLGVGFRPEEREIRQTLDFDVLHTVYRETPGLVSDKLKAVLDLVWQHLKREGRRGLIFAYDEAHNLSDHPRRDEYPLSLLLDVFQSVQKMGMPLMLVLAGLPTLFPKLVEARTFAERMFRVVFVDRLNEQESREAIVKPIQQQECPFALEEESIRQILDASAGYPFFLQFMAREVVDLYLQNLPAGRAPLIPMDGILRKLDGDFFAGRWARATDRQRDLLTVIAHLENSGGEFTVQEITDKSRDLLAKPFSPSHTSQLLGALCKSNLIYKNRHGKYSFAVPLLGQFILRQAQSTEEGAP